MRDFSRQSDPSLNPQFRRRWTEVPRCAGFRAIGEIVPDALDGIARRAVEHWLSEAERSRGDERQAALDIAEEIARMSGLDLAEVSGRRDAA